MREQIFDVDDAKVVADDRDKPIIIAFDVEDCLVSDEVSMAKCLAYVAQVVP